jgi:hypothetical protein
LSVGRGHFVFFNTLETEKDAAAGLVGETRYIDESRTGDDTPPLPGAARAGPNPCSTHLKTRATPQPVDHIVKTTQIPAASAF